MSQNFEIRKANRNNIDPLNAMYGKVPPQAPELEDAVIGACLLERNAISDAYEILPNAEMFYKSDNQAIWQVILDRHKSGAQIDLMIITEELRKNNMIDIVGGAHALTLKASAVISSAHVMTHAAIVREKFMLREGIRICMAGINSAYDNGDAFDVLDSISTSIFEVSGVAANKAARPLAGIMFDAMKELDKRRNQVSSLTGVPTGFEKLDQLTGGWQKSNLIIIAARPSVGKTAFSLNTALTCAKAFNLDRYGQGGTVAVFNMEMGGIENANRIISNLSGIEMIKINQPKKLMPSDMPAILAASQQASKLPIYIDDTAAIGTVELRAKARRLKEKHDLKLIVIDYLQLMEGAKDQKGNREQEISKISRDLKKLAKELEVPIIALSQLTRAPEQLNRDPQLSDLRESGAIEQDADVVIFLYRPSAKTIAEYPMTKGKIIAKIAKHRNGPVGDETAVMINANNHLQRWTQFDSYAPVPEETPTGYQTPRPNIDFNDHI